jgi:hypothetical protein
VTGDELLVLVEVRAVDERLADGLRVSQGDAESLAELVSARTYC